MGALVSGPAGGAVRLGYDSDLLAAVCERLARTVMQDLPRAVKQRHGLASVTPLRAGVMVATPARMTAVLAQVHVAVLTARADDDLDMDLTLRACVQRSLAGPHFAPAGEPLTAPPLTMSAFGCTSSASHTPPMGYRRRFSRPARL